MPALAARRLLCGALLLATLGACGRTNKNSAGALPASSGGSATTGSAGMSGSGRASGSGGASGGAAGGASTCCELGQCPCGGQVAEPGRGVVPMHRLRSSEYHNTIGDLLGVDAKSPVPDEEKPYEALITDAAPWLDAVSRLTQQLFSVTVGPLSPPPFVCVFPAGADRECAAAIVDDLGLRAFRRPVLDQEKTAFLRVYDNLRMTDNSHVAIEQMVRAMLLSPAFLFHVELSDDPDG
ncbi:MAG TPA: DUF1595 domain-containing protein, partial [Polyangiaceae bacterium]|nr:DUF1595 domain-containing protein [Polyangiaceae bacterium]